LLVDEVSHKPGGRLPLLSARPAVTLPARRPVPVSLLGEQRHDGCEQLPEPDRTRQRRGCVPSARHISTTMLLTVIVLPIINVEKN